MAAQQTVRRVAASVGDWVKSTFTLPPDEHEDVIKCSREANTRLQKAIDELKQALTDDGIDTRPDP